MYFLLIWSASSVTVDHNGVSNVLEAWSIEVLDHMELSICVWIAFGIWNTALRSQELALAQESLLSNSIQRTAIGRGESSNGIQEKAFGK